MYGFSAKSIITPLNILGLLMRLVNWYLISDFFSGAQMYKDPNDGMTYEWDTKKRAWFPRINEDFLAQYQMNYGFTKDGVAEPTKPEEISPEDLAKTTETGKLNIWFLREVSKKV